MQIATYCLLYLQAQGSIMYTRMYNTGMTGWSGGRYMNFRMLKPLEFNYLISLHSLWSMVVTRERHPYTADTQVQ